MAGGNYTYISRPTTKKLYLTKKPKTEPPKQVATKTYVKKAISASKENKFVDSPSTSRYTALGATLQAPYLINVIPQGDSAENRDGSKVKLKYLKLDIDLTNSATQSINSRHNFRFVLLHVKNPRGVAPSTDGSDVFDQANPKINSQYNSDISFSTRFKVLKDWKVSTGDFINSVNSSNHWYTRCYMPLNIIQEYIPSNTNGAIAGIDKGALYLYCIADNSQGSFTMSMAHKLTFKDM